VTIENPWKQNPWFESVGVTHRHAKMPLPAPVYAALVAASERRLTIADKEATYREIVLAPHLAAHLAERAMATSVITLDISLPVIVSPTDEPRAALAATAIS
jgi:pre-mycofactocin synthase